MTCGWTCVPNPDLMKWWTLVQYNVRCNLWYWINSLVSELISNVRNMQFIAYLLQMHYELSSQDACVWSWKMLQLERKNKHENSQSLFSNLLSVSHTADKELEWLNVEKAPKTRTRSFSRSCSTFSAKTFPKRTNSRGIALSSSVLRPKVCTCACTYENW